MFSKNELIYSLSNDEEKIFINSTILVKKNNGKNGFYELS
jgi:hypothetical protein